MATIENICFIGLQYTYNEGCRLKEHLYIHLSKSGVSVEIGGSGEQSQRTYQNRVEDEQHRNWK